MNYGTIEIIDGVFKTPPVDGRLRRGMTRLTPGPDGVLAPPVPVAKSGVFTFVMKLHYNQYAYLWGGSKGPAISGVPVSYSKTITRLADPSNPVAAAKKFVVEYAGCDEAAKFRGRAIALSRIHKTISREEFRFPLEVP